MMPQILVISGKIKTMQKDTASDTINTPLISDIAIAGGGIAGLCLALAIKSTLKAAVKVVVADAGLDLTSEGGSWRASAIAAGPRHMLEVLGVWPLLKEAQPILKMVCTDSALHDPVRPVFLQFDPVKADEPFAHMVFNAELRQALLTRCREEGVELKPVNILNFSTHIDCIELETGDGAKIEARLLVAADGARSKLRDKARIQLNRRAYDQCGIVATLEHERPHEGRAEEHFLPDGPFAILPLTGNRSSIVWSDKQAHAKALLALDDEDFMAELERRFTLRLGKLHLLDRPQAFPLNLQFARSYIAERFALLGDAAHQIHPIAGQGLNLGLKDVASLAELIVEQMRLGLDPGSADVLTAYQRARRFDSLSMGTASDLMFRLFSNDLLPVRLARDLGLGLVDKLPGLKNLFIREASGLLGGVPHLLRGEKL
jgi:2-octaprenyl-6-methoxyphenol hydroxylase